tara:strand:+ start:823 stop:1035 length:213 start_codon:yes stop_codon:yes gene_type:complete
MDFESCLIEYQNDYLNFNVINKKYNSEQDAIQAQKNSFIPFSFYLDNKIDKLRLRSVPSDLVRLGFGLKE